jgi:hypothetical protein
MFNNFITLARIAMKVGRLNRIIFTVLSGPCVRDANLLIADNYGFLDRQDHRGK